MSSNTLTYDAGSDVLYVKLPGAQVYASQPIEDDDFVILNRDRGGDIVGLQLVAVQEMTAVRWRQYFNTGEIPAALFTSVANWLDGATSWSGIRSRVPAE